MRGGPKTDVTARLHLQSLPKDREKRVVAFIQRYCRVPKGSPGAAARSPVKLRPWQLEVIHGLYGTDPAPRQGLVSISRKNGKTFLAAALSLYHLLGDGEDSAEVLVVSSDERTAMVTYNLARRMIELEPRLLAVCHIYKDKIVEPRTDSVMSVLSGDATRAQGRNPSFAVVDECHVTDPDCWDALALGQATRTRPLILGISTECGPNDVDNLMARLVQHGRTAEDAAFLFREWSAPIDCEVDDPKAWAAANPMLGDTLSAEHLAALVRTTREPAFRRYHLNQRVALAGTWMPLGAWDLCKEDRSISAGAEVVLGLDGSYNGDCTGLVACTVSPRPHLQVVGLWQPAKAAPVDILAVEDAIRAACKTFRVRELVADPYRWARSLQLLAAEGIPAVEMPQSATRMTPATTGLYEAVVNRQITHSGDADLSKHVSNAVIREDARGTRVSKPSKDSPRRIDLAVCAIMAHSRASFYATQPTKRRRVVAF